MLEYGDCGTIKFSSKNAEDEAESIPWAFHEQLYHTPNQDVRVTNVRVESTLFPLSSPFATC